MAARQNCDAEIWLAFPLFSPPDISSLRMPVVSPCFQILVTLLSLEILSGVPELEINFCHVLPCMGQKPHISFLQVTGAGRKYSELFDEGNAEGQAPGSIWNPHFFFFFQIPSEAKQRRSRCFETQSFQSYFLSLNCVSGCPELALCGDPAKSQRKPRGYCTTNY